MKEEAMAPSKPKPTRSGGRIWAKALTPEAKAEIAGRCKRFITEVLKPKFLPEIKPTAWNYPVAMFGKWRGSKYSFIVRRRSGFTENAGEEFEDGFVRLDHAPGGPEYLFDVMWLRATRRWWPVYRALTLEEALHAIETDEVLWPPV
jgi:hypothetical protein